MSGPNDRVGPSAGGYEYAGGELGLFAHARNWKAYLAARIGPMLRRAGGARVLEVGAGLGATAEVLCDGSQSVWVGLEPDARLLASFAGRVADGRLPKCCAARAGTTADLAAETARDADRFDAIIYIDVLEHIRADREELARAATLLSPGGRLVVLSPAHQFLYAPFDRAIGHERRYSRRSLAAVGPPGLTRETLMYLDCVGLLASLANRVLLRQSMPTAAQIRVWDRLMVPLSRRLADPLTFGRVGKSVLGVWRAGGG